MQAETKLQESEEEQAIISLRISKDLEMKLIAEVIENLQFKELEKRIVEDEEDKRPQEKVEEEKETFLEYGIEVETAYSKDKGAYHVEQPYEKDHGNQTGYENKQ